MKKRSKAGAVLLLTLGGIVGSILPASAHVEFSTEQAMPGSHPGLEILVPHDCSGSKTTQIQIKLPSNVDKSMIMPIGVMQNNRIPKGWSLNYVAKTGLLVAKGPGVTTSEAKPLKIDFMITVPKVKVGSVIKFPTLQICGSKKVSWVQPRPTDGSDPAEDAFPVPQVEIVSKLGK